MDSSTDYSEKSLKNEFVILMEDNLFLAEFTREALLDFGYNVLIAANGEELLEHCHELEKNKIPIAVVLLDLTIEKGMGGREVVKIMKSKYPHIKAVATSGHSHDPAILNPKNYGFETSIKKPYHIEGLIEAFNKIKGG